MLPHLGPKNFVFLGFAECQQNIANTCVSTIFTTSFSNFPFECWGFPRHPKVTQGQQYNREPNSFTFTCEMVLHQQGPHLQFSHKTKSLTHLSDTPFL